MSLHAKAYALCTNIIGPQADWCMRGSPAHSMILVANENLTFDLEQVVLHG